MVEFAAEFRLFVLDGVVRAGSRYATWGRLDPEPLGRDVRGARVLGFAAEFLSGVGDTLPSGVVLDIGLVGPPGAPGRDVAVVEANMAWFSRTYQAEPGGALDTVLRSAGPVGEVREADRPFLGGC
ncbi:hypothetical protein Aglo01_22950 [Actinokineospora globicatena]|nr:hypothetical protein Aglo01_22950 [Actinokineospora globicatena]GLW85519.1 hypothetical protein Aglo02_31590 [Actinokineospora globicatena]